MSHGLRNLGPPSEKTVAAGVREDRMRAGGSMSAAQSLAFALLAVGCATGGKDGGDLPIDAPKAVDSSQVAIDAPMQIVDAHQSVIDAPIVMIDAAVMIDAPSGPFCNGNAECTVAGQCCLSVGGPGFCVPGAAVGSICFPN